MVELVAVILLLGILSVYIAPKFSGRQGFAEYALRDQFISSYRYAQQRAMYDHTEGVCYRLSITGSGFEPQRNGLPFGNFSAVVLSGDYSGLSVDPPEALYFDGLGNVYTVDCGGTAVGNPRTLTMGSVTAEVYPTGYIKAI